MVDISDITNDIPTPNIYFKIFLVVFVLFIAFGSGYYLEHLRFVDYKEKEDATVAQKVQQLKDKNILDKHIGNEVVNEKKADINAINNYDFSKLLPPSTNGVSKTRSNSTGINYQAAYRVLAKQCATTTLDYDRLIEYLEKTRNDQQ
jgi:hypothetical protein